MASKKKKILTFGDLNKQGLKLLRQDLLPKWFAQFYARDFLMDDAPWSDRPVEGDSN